MRLRFGKLIFVIFLVAIPLVALFAVAESAFQHVYTEKYLSEQIIFSAPDRIINAAGNISLIDTADLDNDGQVDIAYSQNSSLNVARNTVGLNGIWSTVHNVGSTSEEIVAVVNGDLNRDGRIDLVTLSGDGVKLWGNPAASFTDTWFSGATLTVTTGITQSSLAISDLDRDGVLDIVVGDGNGVLRLRKNPLGFQGVLTTNWGTDKELPALTGEIIDLQVSDLDLDSMPDLIVLHNKVSPTLRLWRNPGAAFGVDWTENVDFLPSTVLTLPNASHLVVGDMDGDIWPDIVVGDSNGELQGWSNPGITPFNSAWVTGLTFNSVIGGLQDLTAADVNYGADIELVGLSGSTPTGIYVWERVETLGNGSGTNTWSVSLVQTYAGALTSVDLADLDLDGDLDLTAGGSDGIYGIQNHLVPWTIGFDTTGHTAGYDDAWLLDLVIADLDRDGAVDLVTGEMYGRIIARRNDGTPFNGEWITNEVGLMPDWWECMAVASGDLDNDGDVDLVSGYFYDHGPVIWENDGDPFAAEWEWSEIGTQRVGAIKTADVNGDGRLDIITGGGQAWSDTPSNENQVIVWYAPASPFSDTWQMTNVGLAYYSVLDLDVGDLDNDGDLDIVIGTNHAPPEGDEQNPVPRDQWADVYQIRAYRNDGSDNWTEFDIGRDPEIETLQFVAYHGFWGANVTGVSLVDLDNDGDLDIAATETLEGDFMVMGWQNDGTPFSGELWQPSAIAKGDEHNWILASVWWVEPADLDRDGDIDLVAGSGRDEPYQVMIWENSGIAFGDVISDTAWIRHDVGMLGEETRIGGVADFDQDGDPDLVAGAFVSEESEIRLWENYVGPDIALSITPEHQEVTFGQTAYYTVEVTGLYGFDQMVNLWVSGLPSGMNVSWSRNPLTPTDQSILSLTASLFSLPQEYHLLAVAIGENATGIAPFTVRVNPAQLYPLFLPLVLMD